MRPSAPTSERSSGRAGEGRTVPPACTRWQGIITISNYHSVVRGTIVVVRAGFGVFPARLAGGRVGVTTARRGRKRRCPLHPAGRSCRRGRTGCSWINTSKRVCRDPKKGSSRRLVSTVTHLLLIVLSFIYCTVVQHGSDDVYRSRARDWVQASKCVRGNPVVAGAVRITYST